MFSNKKLLFSLSVFLIAVIFLVYFYFVSEEQKIGKNELWQASVLGARTIKIGGKSFNVEISDTQASRINGLSGRSELSTDSGMLFVFERPDFYGFWMKEMNFPIDIIWLDKNLRVVHIENDVSPETFPKVFNPVSPALYVLEINSGLAEKYGIMVGAAAELL